MKSFPKIGKQNNKQLQEFGDLLLELQCAKNDGRIKGLQILHEPAYLRPIVAKLPADLQARWQKQAFKYKTQQVVDYPPFAEISRFIPEVVKERNDPYLTLKSCHECGSFRGLSTAKTAVTTPESSEKVKSVESPDKWCFLHERPHPLRVCRELRSRPYSERLDLLARRHICFRCVSSSSHTAKDCTFTPNCGICHSDRHSLRSKRFQSSYSRKLLRAEAKKRLKGDGEGRRGNACPQTPRFWKTPLDISRFGSFVNWQLVKIEA